MEPLEARIVNLAMLLKNRAMLARGGDLGGCQIVGRASNSGDITQLVEIDLHMSAPSEETRVSTSAAFWEAARLVEALLPNEEEVATMAAIEMEAGRLRVELECARREIAMLEAHKDQWRRIATELVAGANHG